MENDSNQVESNPPADAGKAMPGSAPPESSPATNKAFREYEEQLRKIDIPQAHTAMESAHTTYTSSRLSRWKIKCALQKAEETLHFYQDLSDNIGVFARKEAALIKSKIDTTVSENNKRVSDTLAASFSSLKIAKAKLSDLRSKGDDLFQKLTDSDYSDAVAELVKCFKDSTPTDKSDTEKNFRDSIDRLKKSSTRCFDLGDDAVEIVVKIAGIHANSSIPLLGPVGSDVASKVDILQKDIETNITAAQGKSANSQKDYNAAMETLTSAKYSKYAKGLVFGGLLQVASQVSSPDCKEWPHEKIAEALDQYAHHVEANMKKLT